MKTRPPSTRPRIAFACLVMAGAITAGLAVARHWPQTRSPAVVRPAPPRSTRVEMKSEKRTTVLSLVQSSTPAARDAARAAFFNLKTNSSGETDRYRCGILFRQWAELDFTAALECADGQPAGGWREEMFGWLALVIAPLSPAEAAAIADYDMQPGAVRSETAISILHQWAQVDATRAAAWADSFPQGPLRERAFNEVAGRLRPATPN